MDREETRYGTLLRTLGSTFHQDWDLDFRSIDQARRELVGPCSPDAFLLGLHDDLGRLLEDFDEAQFSLEAGDTDLTRMLERWGVEVYPPRSWWIALREAAVGELDARTSGRPRRRR